MFKKKIDSSSCTVRHTRTKRLSGFFACTALLGAACVAQADSITSGIGQQLGSEAADRTFFGEAHFGTVEDGGDGRLDVGDRLNGQFIIRTISNPGPGGSSLVLGGVDATPSNNINELTGYIELEVKSKTGNASTGFTYEFGAFTSGPASIVNAAGNPNAIIALYEDSSRNGILAGLPIPDPSLTDGQLFGYLGLGTPGTRKFTVTTVAGADGQHSDASSAALDNSALLQSTADVSLNLVEQYGDAITDEANGQYEFMPNALGTQFTGNFNFFGGAGMGSDFNGQFSLTSNISLPGELQIIPLPPAALAAIPGMLMVAGYKPWKRRKAV